MRVVDGDRVASFARVPQGADENGIITSPIESLPTKGKVRSAVTTEFVPADGG
jgi:hypothetical protein